MQSIDEKKEKKLVIALPTSGLVDWRFASSLVTLELNCQTRIIWQIRVMIDYARNNLVEQAMLDPTYTHLLFLDDDMTFDSDFALRLLEHDVDIVGGLAFKRRPDYAPCVYKRKEDGILYPILPTIYQEVDAIGTAGLLIKLDVFKNISQPWFTTYYDEQGRHFSVDIDFCQKAKAKGYKIWVDPNCKMGHIGDPELVTQDTFLKHCEKLNEQINNKIK